MTNTPEYGQGLATYISAEKHALVGSTYILGQGKDVDWLFLVPCMAEAAEFLSLRGWACESEMYDSYENDTGGFVSFRLGNCNALVTTDVLFFERFVRAAEVCRLMRLEDRDDRVAVHRVVLYGKGAAA